MIIIIIIIIIIIASTNLILVVVVVVVVVVVMMVLCDNKARSSQSLSLSHTLCMLHACAKGIVGYFLQFFNN